MGIRDRFFRRGYYQRTGQAEGESPVVVPHTQPMAEIEGLPAALATKESAGTAAALLATHLLEAHGEELPGEGGGPTAWGSITGTLADQTDLVTALAGKAPTAHSHALDDVAGIYAALSERAPALHGHLISDIQTLPATLTGKAAAVHTHAQADVTNLVTDLAGKAAAAHTHTIAQVTSLQASLDAKAAATHSHAIGDVTGLQTALDGKAASGHNHAITGLTGFPGGTATFLRADQTFAAPPAGGSSPVYTVLANGATAMEFGVNDVVKVTPTANATYTTTVPAAGRTKHLIVLTSGTTSRTITFGTGFKAAGTLATGTVTARVFVIHWVSDGVNLYEAGRTAALVA